MIKIVTFMIKKVTLSPNCVLFTRCILNDIEYKYCMIYLPWPDVYYKVYVTQFQPTSFIEVHIYNNTLTFLRVLPPFIPCFINIA